MAYRTQGTLGDVWVTLWDPQTTFLVLHGEPEACFFRLALDIFTSRCWQAHQHKALADRSSNLPLNFSLDYGEASNSSLKIEPAFAVSMLWRSRTRRGGGGRSVLRAVHDLVTGGSPVTRGDTVHAMRAATRALGALRWSGQGFWADWLLQSRTPYQTRGNASDQKTHPSGTPGKLPRITFRRTRRSCCCVT
jgi:hypothetical protein